MPAAAGLAKAVPGAARRGDINDLDWMTTSCLSASTRPFNVFDVRPADQAGLITFPWILRHWFVAAGAMVRADTTIVLGAFKDGLLDTLSLMQYWPNSWIVLQIDFIADWTTNLRFVSWANPAYGIFSGKIGRLRGRVYGGYAFSHFA